MSNQSAKGSRRIEFELLDIVTQDYFYVELEVHYEYYHDPGCYSGRPEDCYPDDEYSEAYVNDQDIINLNPTQYESLKEQIDEYLANADVRSWAEDERQSYEADKADAMYDRLQDERLGL